MHNLHPRHHVSLPSLHHDYSVHLPSVPPLAAQKQRPAESSSLCGHLLSLPWWDVNWWISPRESKIVTLSAHSHRSVHMPLPQISWSPILSGPYQQSSHMTLPRNLTCLYLRPLLFLCKTDDCSMHDVWTIGRIFLITVCQIIAQQQFISARTYLPSQPMLDPSSAFFLLHHSVIRDPPIPCSHIFDLRYRYQCNRGW